MMPDISTALITGVPGAIVTGIFGFILLHRQGANAESLANISNRLASLSEMEKTRFNWLHQRRAEAMIEISALLSDVDDAMHVYTGYGMGLRDNKTLTERHLEFHAAGDALRKAMRNHACLFSRQMRELLDATNAVYVGISNDFMLAMVVHRDDKEAIHHLKYPERELAFSNYKLIQDEFRKLLGSEDNLPK